MSKSVYLLWSAEKYTYFKKIDFKTDSILETTVSGCSYNKFLASSCLPPE